MKAARIVPAFALALSACASSTNTPDQSPSPAPAARPAPTPAQQAPTVIPAEPPSNWADRPATPGSWRYAARDAASEATFGLSGQMPLARLLCAPGSRTVTVFLPRIAGREPLVAIQTESLSRTLPLLTNEDGAYVSLTADDPLLDAMALSKGRFAIQATGLPLLILPSWAEVSRVIEDCR